MTCNERNASRVYSRYHGSVYGDGIYTANNPFAFHGRYGETCILVARLQGNRFCTDKRRDPLRFNDADCDAINIDTVVGGSQSGFDQQVLLKTSSQCIPLMYFSSLMVDRLQDHGLENDRIHNIHKLLQEKIDHFFNDDKQTVVNQIFPSDGKFDNFHIKNIPRKRKRREGVDNYVIDEDRSCCSQTPRRKKAKPSAPSVLVNPLINQLINQLKDLKLDNWQKTEQ